MQKWNWIARAFAAMNLKLFSLVKAKAIYYKTYNNFKNNVGSGLHLVGFPSRK